MLSPVWLGRFVPQGALLLVVSAISTLTATARAGTFNSDGVFSFDPLAVVQLDFEQPLPSGSEGAALTRVASETALSGGWVLSLAPYQFAEFPVVVPQSPRTYRVSLWIRGAEATGFVGVSYSEPSDHIDELSLLYPTGRMTSDGWVELANDGLRIDGARANAVSIGAAAPLGVEVDAMEMVVDGVIEAAANPPCDGITHASACGTGQVCQWSECRNVNGWVPPIPPERDQLTDYFENRLKFFFGPFLNRTLDLPNALIAIEQMRHATDPFSFWNGWLLAVRRLHDAHTTTNGLASYAVDDPKPLTVCFLEGEADLSHHIEPADPLYRDVLVSHIGGGYDLGLKPGDRLVRIDGQHPVAWARSLITANWAQPQPSNHETFAEPVAALNRLISRYAHSVEVIRCASDTQQCGPVQTVSITDLPPYPEGARDVQIHCDHRPLRHLASSPADHVSDLYDVFVGVVNESDATERIYGVEWESLSTSNGADGVAPQLSGAIETIRNEGARGVIFDHRTGYGGTFAGPPIIFDYTVPLQPLTFMQTRQRAEDEQPTVLQGQALFQHALEQGWVWTVGTSTPTTIPVALLITRDASASDWLALGMKKAPNVQLFGPYQTSGAFSTRLVFSYWFGMMYVVASCDTFVSSGATLNGTGVEPDVVVQPQQSDLLAGVDTVFEAALSWIRQELTP